MHLLTGLLAITLLGPTTGQNRRIEQIIGDMTLPHEAVPSGVPENVDWRLKPRMGMGNNPGTFRAFTAWGQVYNSVGSELPSNTRIHMRHIQAWLLNKKTNRWELMQYSPSMAGALYREDFVDDINIPADKRDEKPAGLSVRLAKGYNYHFWPDTGARVAIDPETIGGWYTAVQARLISHDPRQPEDRRRARVMMSMGADYWLALDSQWDQWKTNGDLAIGRFRFITPGWQWFHMTTLSPEEIRRNPPPAPKVD